MKMPLFLHIIKISNSAYPKFTFLEGSKDDREKMADHERGHTILRNDGELDLLTNPETNHTVHENGKDITF